MKYKMRIVWDRYENNVVGYWIYNIEGDGYVLYNFLDRFDSKDINEKWA